MVIFGGINIMNRWLNSNYYIGSDGTIDPIVDSLGDCVVQASYIIGKNKYDMDNFFVAYLNESTLTIQFDENGAFNGFGTIENIFERGSFRINRYYDTNERTAEKVSELLAEDIIPIIYPIIERFPFAELYDPNYDKQVRKSHHVFIIVGEDDENFFFVDNPAVIVYSNFTSYEHNSEIGVISKKEFSESAKYCCDIMFIEHYPELIRDDIRRWKLSFLRSHDHYYNESTLEDDKITYYGKEAVIKLRGIFDSEQLLFSDDAPTHDRDMMTYFRWRIWNVRGRRMLQREYLKRFYSENEEIRKVMMQALDNSLLYWDLLNKSMYKDSLNGMTVIGKRYLSLIDKIADAEDNMHRAYKQFLN